MSHIIKQLHIEKLFGTTNIDWELNPSVNVLVGQNGLGKSTILKIIHSVIHQELTDEIELVSQCTVDFFGNVSFSMYSKEVEDDRISEILFKGLKDSEDSRKRLVNTLNNILMEEVNTENVEESLKKILPFYFELDTRKPVFYKEFFDNQEIKEKVNIEFISTINLSANSISEITTSSGQHTNFLDFEISNEMQRLLAFNDDSLKENLLSALNNLFAETQKTIEFNEKNSTNKLLVKLANGEEIPFSKLSSGERQVIFIFLKVVIASVDGALILMDEPEISLHLSWQEKLLSEIRRINTKSQIIIVTHSPAMLMNGWMDSFVDIANIMTDVSNNHPAE